MLAEGESVRNGICAKDGPDLCDYLLEWPFIPGICSPKLLCPGCHHPKYLRGSMCPFRLFRGMHRHEPQREKRADKIDKVARLGKKPHGITLEGLPTLIIA